VVLGLLVFVNFGFFDRFWGFGIGVLWNRLKFWTGFFKYPGFLFFLLECGLFFWLFV
jgi:hypothetical protein